MTPPPPKTTAGVAPAYPGQAGAGHFSGMSVQDYFVGQVLPILLTFHLARAGEVDSDSEWLRTLQTVGADAVTVAKAAIDAAASEPEN